MVERIPRRALLGAAVAFGGCAVAPTPPLRRLYRRTLSSPEQPPLIVIPGAFGSRLTDVATGREIWPGSPRKILFSKYDELELEIDANSLESAPHRMAAATLFDNGVGRDFYGRLTRTLEDVGGYRMRAVGDRPEAGERNYYVFLYDWRIDNVASALGLRDLIERVRADYDNPQLQFDIVAHSNGGLLARYFARYGAEPLADGVPRTTTEGARSIRRLIVLGTPNLGTIQAALAHTRGEEMIVRRVDQEVVASWPSVCQLLPHPAMPWLIDARGDTVDLPVFSIDSWRELGWSVFDPVVRERVIARRGGGAAGRAYLSVLERYFAKSLAEGLTFSRAISAPAPVDDVAPYVFGSDCTPTLARILVENIEGRHLARESVTRRRANRAAVDYSTLMFQPGDGVVTRESLLGACTSLAESRCTIRDALRIEHSVFLCEEHQSLTGNRSFQNNLLYTLLSV